MPCEECDRLQNQLSVAEAAYKAAVGSISGLHAWDLQFQRGQDGAETARQRLERCRSAVIEHRQHHQDVEPKG